MSRFLYKMHLFQKVMVFIVVFFIGLLLLMTLMKKTEHPGLDVHKMQQLQEEASTGFNPAQEF